jgi:hypothetical protein
MVVRQRCSGGLTSAGIRSFPSLRPQLAPIHEETTFEAAMWVSKIKGYFRSKGISQNEILEQERRAQIQTERRVLDDAKRYSDKFPRLCQAIPSTFKNQTYMFRPLRSWYPDVTRVLRQ